MNITEIKNYLNKQFTRPPERFPGRNACKTH